MKHKLKGVAETREVWLDDKKLSPRRSQKLHNHSPDGFSWGYYGSGCAQLALAITLKLTGRPDGYQDFKRAVIAQLPFNEDFECTFDYYEFGDK